MQLKRISLNEYSLYGVRSQDLKSIMLKKLAYVERYNLRMRYSCVRFEAR